MDKFLFPLVLLFFLAKLSAQTQNTSYIRCSTMDADEELRKNYPNLGTLNDFENWLAPKVAAYKRNQALNPGVRNVLTIPVVVHVIHNGDAVGTGENISDAQVLSQIQVMNEDYRRIAGSRGFNSNAVGADVEIEFCMAQVDPNGNATDGINRVNMGRASWDVRTDVEGVMKPTTIWDPTLYLNMWTARFGGSMGGLLGYAQFPQSTLPGVAGMGGASNTDGVVMVFNAFGTADLDVNNNFNLNPTYNLGRTVTHEVGHWLGLRHIWGDGNCTVDDFCNDTPESDAANYNCATHNSCGTRDMIENYMDYTNDACMNIFTLDQKARMQTVMANSVNRASLATSTKCDPPSAEIAFTLDNAVLVEGTNCGHKDITLELTISKAASADATVTFSLGGTATNLSDYELLSNSVVFPAGSTTSQFVTLRIHSDGIVEANETVDLSFTVTTSGDARATGSSFAVYNLTIANDDNAPSAGGVTNLLNADFNTGGGGFSISGAASSDNFTLGSEVALASTYWSVTANNSGNIAYTNDDNCGNNCDKSRDRLISPSMDLSSGYTSVSLTFDQAFANVGDEVGTVEVSTDGGNTWTSIYTLTNTSTATGGGAYQTPWKSETVSLDAYLGNNDVRFCFRYDDGGDWAYGMAVDNVVVDAQTNTVIQTNINTTLKDSVKIGPNNIVTFWDPATKNLMATIQNTSTWDYQCTTVEVDRDAATVGAATAPFWDNLPANAVMTKTFFINPNKNTISGTYNATFYCTEAEVAAWEAATGQSRANMKIIKIASTPVSAVNATNYTSYQIDIIPATVATFGTDVSFTASFTTGFSGFALGNPTAPILAVDFLDFFGKTNTGGNLLTWIVNEDEKNSHFVLERSTDGINFEAIQEIDAYLDKGENRYSYLDANPKAGDNYYRIVAYTTNGEKDISSIIVLNYKVETIKEVKILPNPAKTTINIQYTSTREDELAFEILDIRGQQIFKQEGLPIDAGRSTIHFNVKDYPKGVYILRIQDAQGNYTTKRFVKN